MAEAMEAFFHIDSKMFLTLKTLVTSSGQINVRVFSR